MYRLAHNPGVGNNKIIQKLVSDQIIDCIETIFGPLNEDGHFSDIDRVVEFMKRSTFLKDLVGKNYVSGNGLLKTETPWSEIIKNRYEDMLIKVKDKKHEYTFNEIGEGLLNLIFSFFAKLDYSYLLEYADTDDVFEPFGMYVGVLERRSYYGLRETLNEAGKSVFDELIEDEEFEEELEDEIEDDRLDFANYYEELWFNYFLEPVNLGFEGYRYTELFEFAQEIAPSKYGSKWEHSLVTDVLFWDNDFAFVMPLLNDKKEMNRFIKACGNYFGYKVNSADIAALSTDNDTVCDL